ncbi:hypothetical protein NJBCHELONAE_47710 [Mycobacteroides chelonae]|uniref:hypothetical protein n=1 Tax=Mycobacteroides chelonae TaxID=1774 RepID=UPI0021DC3637|nr:hypothetical protein [Mycobacteroides chelonae]GLE59458.1 hypothetical protein NJBCHELONAE_47710 [Mycobacteroides chelonae]
MDNHAPTSGSPEALGTCIEHMKANGLDTRATGKDTYPRVTVDMGYDHKRGWGAILDQARLQPRRPIPEALDPDRSLDQPARIIGDRATRADPVRGLVLRPFRRAASPLAAVLPFLMGTNSRPIVNGRPDRPRLGDEHETHVKAELVCPAVQLRVWCPLTPASMQSAAFGVPLATPTWQADERTCCRQSTPRVTPTQPQLQKATWGGPVVTTWEHALYFEAARSATEQR